MYSIEVIDINGKIIQLQQVQLTRGYNHLEVDISEIPSGVYMINFRNKRLHQRIKIGKTIIVKATCN